jgi:hypothetical protein
MADQVVRAVIDESGFGALVAGEMVSLRGVTDNGMVTVELLLDDIGWDRLQRALSRAHRRPVEGNH